MDSMTAEEKKRRDYWHRVRQHMPQLKFWPLDRLVAALALSGGQRGFAVLRHKWNPKSPPPELIKEVVIFTVATIIIYMVMYAFEWSWNYVVMAPMIMDGDNQEQLTKQKNEISSLKLELDSSEKVKNVKRKLAPLINQEISLHDRLLSAQDGAELTSGAAAVREWVSRVITLLKEADEPTDAEVFSQAGRVVSAQQLAEFHYVRDWKREEVARLTLYCRELAQIKSTRRF